MYERIRKRSIKRDSSAFQLGLTRDGLNIVPSRFPGCLPILPCTYFSCTRARCARKFFWFYINSSVDTQRPVYWLNFAVVVNRNPRKNRLSSLYLTLYKISHLNCYRYLLNETKSPKHRNGIKYPTSFTNSYIFRFPRITVWLLKIETFLRKNLKYPSHKPNMIRESNILPIEIQNITININFSLKIDQASDSESALTIYKIIQFNIISFVYSANRCTNAIQIAIKKNAQRDGARLKPGAHWTEAFIFRRSCSTFHFSAYSRPSVESWRKPVFPTVRTIY